MPLSGFHPIIADWFRGRFGAPTEVQVRSWPAIASGTDTLIAAPTGSGKTLAAFLSCLDGLLKQALGGELEDRVQVLYVSPLKALSNDIQKNLQQPLAEIAEAAMASGCLLPELRVLVRTGDTPAWARQQMIRRPPHILVTTPESLYLLLTGPRSRAMLRDVRTVIVDEIHALAPNKRGAHLSLSLERLEADTTQRPVRIGLSATQRPIETVAKFLVGAGGAPSSPATCLMPRASCQIIDIGHRRQMDLAVEVPHDELGAVATNAIWSDIYDRLAGLVQEHRSTLVFVNTRRLVERVSHHLEERLGTRVVAAHHGSLSREIRLSAETRLKEGETRVVVATASLELGIDVGTVDLVCQVGSPRSIAVCLQRVGRSGHWVGAMPKGRLFATTRDELIECAALIRAFRQGDLDRIEVPPAPLDILAQQIVATVSTREWGEDELFALCRRAYPYRALNRPVFDAVLRMLADGLTTRHGRRAAYLHHDRIHRRLRARRGARLAAIVSGGAIPDTANYAVIAEPEGTLVGSVDEDFAVESLAGDIILLGNASWRIRGVETGKVRVEDARGAPPTIPFWRGEAPSRTVELSAAVAAVRAEIDRRLQSEQGASSPKPLTPYASPLTWLQEACGLDRRGAEQAVAYMIEGRAVLGAVPTQDTIIAERFFDEGGGMQLVIHAPFGGRINKAWGLALRKRFCVSFDFELQAAATDEGLVLSLGEQHSFPLETVFQFLQPDGVREVLLQAVLAAPMFATRWRWNVTRALALLRFVNGRRVPPQIQRMRAEDLLATVFPAALACQDNHRGDQTDREIPDHPLVAETLRDCLTEAMDVEGLIALLRRIVRGDVRCLAVETPVPSPFCHEILNANPYAYLDDAPLEERRARAVEMRRSLPPELAGNLGALSPQAIAAVADEVWPVVRDADELHDALLSLAWVPEGACPDRTGEWAAYLPALVEAGRATRVKVSLPQPSPLVPFQLNEPTRLDSPSPSPLPLQGGEDKGEGGELLRQILGTAPGREGAEVRGWAATERLGVVQAVWPDSRCEPVPPQLAEQPAPDRAEAVRSIVHGWMESTGPTTAEELAGRLSLSVSDVEQALLRLESEGQVLRGRFRPSAATPYPSPLTPHENEWCDRRLLTRIHRLTIGILRKEIEPVTAADFMRFLFQWQHVVPRTRLHGEAGLLEIIRQLAGFEAAASAWEPWILRLRLSKYDPDLLDRLCLGGQVMWGRLTPHPNLEPGPPPGGGGLSQAGARNELERARQRRIIPTSVAPISLFPREEADWLLPLCRHRQEGGTLLPPDGLAPIAQDLWRYLQSRGASFFADLVRSTHHLPAEVEQGLWELAAAGLVTADGFDNLRALLDPRRRRAQGRERLRRPRHSAGRWSLLHAPSQHSALGTQPQDSGLSTQHSGAAERVARLLLRRYGVVFRDLLGRESLALPWRDLLVQYRRMESRGEIRGGRFIGGFTGEQFALPEAVEALRAIRKVGHTTPSFEVKLSAADPLNLVGVILPGPRVPAVPSNYLLFRDSMPVQSGSVREAVSLETIRREQAGKGQIS